MSSDDAKQALSNDAQRRSDPMILLVSGDRSGIGKSTVCLGLLSGLLGADLGGHKLVAGDLAYIKPVTQCEDVQLVTKFCEREGIAHRGIGPVVFKPGYTRKCIDGFAKLKTASDRLDAVKHAVLNIGGGRKKLVVVDGVGYASVGSVAGVSNAQVAAHLKCPVLLVGKSGVGDAIDMANLNVTYFRSFGVKVLGVVYNNTKPIKEETMNDCATYIKKFHEQHGTDLKYYGHLPHNASLGEWAAKQGDACVLRITNESLIMNDEEQTLVEGITTIHEQNVHHREILADVSMFYSSRV